MQAISEGRVDLFKDKYGSYFTIFGTVIKGDQRGRKIGFPTANLQVTQQIVPQHGMYAVRCTVNNETHLGVMNIGMQSSFQKTTNVCYEAHLFDFNQDIYDKDVSVELIFQVRPEQVFNSEDEIKTQLNKDIAFAKGKLAESL